MIRYEKDAMISGLGADAPLSLFCAIITGRRTDEAHCGQIPLHHAQDPLLVTQAQAAPRVAPGTPPLTIKLDRF